MPVIPNVKSPSARPPSPDDPPVYAEPPAPAYTSRTSHETTLRSLPHGRHSRRTSSSDNSDRNSGSDSPDLRQRPSTGREKAAQDARSTEDTPASHHADPEALDARVTGVADRPDLTAFLPYYASIKDVDTPGKVGKWDEDDWRLLEARIRAFVAFYTARVGSSQHVFRGRSARTQDLHFSRELCNPLGSSRAAAD